MSKDYWQVLIIEFEWNFFILRHLGQWKHSTDSPLYPEINCVTLNKRIYNEKSLFLQLNIAIFCQSGLNNHNHLSQSLCLWFVVVCLYISHRERYALIVTPLLVNAQRRLLERIDSFGGPVVPQPHHVQTHKATGKEVEHTTTHRNTLTHFTLKTKSKCFKKKQVEVTGYCIASCIVCVMPYVCILCCRFYISGNLQELRRLPAAHWV